MSKKNILTVEDQEVLLEAAKSVRRIVLNKFRVPGHADLRFKGSDARIVPRQGEVIGFELSTLTGEDVKENREDLERAIAPLRSYGFHCRVGTTPGDGWLGTPRLTGHVEVTKKF